MDTGSLDLTEVLTVVSIVVLGTATIWAVINRLASLKR